MDWNFAIRPAKIELLKQQFEEFGIRDADLEERFVRGSGKGGQKVNKTNNCVQLKHLPTGITVQSHHERERSLNRFFARRLLIEELQRQRDGGLSSEEQKKIDKIKKQKSRRKRRSQQSKTKEQPE